MMLRVKNIVFSKINVEYLGNEKVRNVVCKTSY
jgi:hypothetical protein